MVFISIDDNEQANLKPILDEVFGEENFQGQFIVNATPNARDYGHIGKMHEYILFYSRDDFLQRLLNWKKRIKYSSTLMNPGYNIHPLL